MLYNMLSPCRMNAEFRTLLAQACRELALPPLAAEPLELAYTAEGRAYHNLDHILACLRIAQEMEVAQPELNLAIIYHDSVYASRAKDNEQQSAAWARRDLAAAGCAAAVMDRIERLILATEHKGAPVEPSLYPIVDVDLAILGSDHSDYQNYCAAVRTEYSWVPEIDYINGRCKFLRSLLARDVIFNLPSFRAKFEQPARANLNHELARLGWR